MTRSVDDASVHVRAETPQDHDAIRILLDVAFGQPAEGRLVELLRAGDHVLVSLVAEIDRRLVGQVLFSRLWIDAPSGTVPGVSLAPLAVAPEVQRKGIGSRLVREGMAECRRLGETIAIVLGNPAVYGRFGFDANLARPLCSPYDGPAFMAAELVPGALNNLSGAVRYPPPFAQLDAEFRKE